MNHNDVRALFEDALASEPTNSPLADEDIARGRALRARRLRRRVGGIGTGALVATALTLPASPLSLVDGDGSASIQPGVPPGSAPLASEVSDDPLLKDMWEAVVDVLPDDVRVARETEVGTTDDGSPIIFFDLQRDTQAEGGVYSVKASLQNSRPDLEELKPCTDPHPSDTWLFHGVCEERRDDQGRWRVTSSTPGIDGMSIVEGGTAAAVVTWGDWGLPGDDDGVIETPSDVLSDEEVDAIAAAVWAVGAEHEPDELMSGIDLSATLDMWPEMHATLEKEMGLGPLTPVKPDDPAAVGGTYDEEKGVVAGIDEADQSGVIAARYETPAGDLIDVIIWQKPRIYDTFCHDRIPDCSVLPFHSVGRSETPDALTEGGFVESLGLRAEIYSGDETGIDPGYSLSPMVPFLGEDRNPPSDGS